MANSSEIKAFVVVFLNDHGSLQGMPFTGRIEVKIGIVGLPKLDDC